MKEIYASATPKTNIICWKQEQIYFNTVKLQNTNKDHQVVFKHGVKPRNLVTLSVFDSVQDTGRSPDSLHEENLVEAR